MLNNNPKILLINPPMAQGWRPYMVPPVGLCYLKASLKKVGLLNTKVVDAGGYSIKRVCDLVSHFYPDILGITMFTETRHIVGEIASRCKASNPNLRIAIGGVHPSVMWEQLLKENPVFDWVFIGEAEQSFPAFFEDRIDGLKPAGIAWRDLPSIKFTGPGLVKDLDTLPIPDYSDLDLTRYRDLEGPTRGSTLGAIITSRGCAFNCLYCSSRSVWGSWRGRSISNVLDEVEYLNFAYGIKTFTIMDDIFTLNRGRALEFCEGLHNRSLSIKWRIQTRTDCVDEDLLREMKRAGLVFIAFGVESGSPTILKNLNKKEDIDKILQAFYLCRLVGVKTCFNVIVGSPGETNETLRETREILKRCHPDYIATAALRVYPGTNLAALAEEEGLLSDRDWLEARQCIYYEGSMSYETMLKNCREFRQLQASLGGVKGWINFYRDGMVSLIRTPGKVFRSFK